MERQTKTNLLLVTTITFVAIAFALTLPKISADESCLSSCGRGEWNWLATYQTDANGWVYFDKLPIGRYNLTWCCDWEEIILTCCDEGWEETNFIQPNHGDKLFQSLIF